MEPASAILGTAKSGSRCRWNSALSLFGQFQTARYGPGVRSAFIGIRAEWHLLDDGLCVESSDFHPDPAANHQPTSVLGKA
jgi:hypothetical protein